MRKNPGHVMLKKTVVSGLILMMTTSLTWDPSGAALWGRSDWSYKETRQPSSGYSKKTLQHCSTFYDRSIHLLITNV